MPQVLEAALDDNTVQLIDDEEDSKYESVLGSVKTFIMYDTRSKINSCHLQVVINPYNTIRL